jgi:GNAT superfamily N-acetyltransferase
LLISSTLCFAAVSTSTPSQPGTGWAFQGITAVLPEHRGHRLGLLAKSEMLELLIGRAPDVRRVLTRNADANRHMAAINERLGYQVSSVHRDWELDLAVARAGRQP